MFGRAWLVLRQAQEAIKNGRFEEAHRLLCQPAAQGHQRSWELLRQVAQGFLERGGRHLEHDDAAAAWRDLLLAEQASSGDSGAERLRQDLVRIGLSEVRTLLQAGEPGRAAEAISKLRDRSVQQADLDVLEGLARDWLLANEQAARGQFAGALQALERVRGQMPGPIKALEQFHGHLEQHQRDFSSLLLELHEAADQGRWRDVIQCSERVLAIAPQHLEARKLRELAWKAIVPVTVIVPRPTERQPNPPPAAEAGSPRFLLWIDGVGGYLVCLGNRITIGQATADAFIDVPIFADVSRLHAILTRDSEGYLLEAVRPVRVNGQGSGKTLLQSNDRLTLGTSCQIQFRQPVPVSASARLDLTSGHRLPLAVDGVLLMADTLVLGCGPQAHVVIPELKKPAILYRAKDGLGIRYGGDLRVDGLPCRERGLLGPESRATGDDFSLAVEPVGARMTRGVLS